MCFNVISAFYTCFTSCEPSKPPTCTCVFVVFIGFPIDQEKETNFKENTERVCCCSDDVSPGGASGSNAPQPYPRSSCNCGPARCRVRDKKAWCDVPTPQDGQAGRDDAQGSPEWQEVRKNSFLQIQTNNQRKQNDITSLSDDKFARGAPKLITASAIIEQVSV